MEENSFDWEEILKKSEKEMGHTNIAIIGKTGVGKSTLINANHKLSKIIIAYLSV